MAKFSVGGMMGLFNIEVTLSPGALPPGISTLDAIEIVKTALQKEIGAGQIKVNWLPQSANLEMVISISESSFRIRLDEGARQRLAEKMFQTISLALKYS